MQHNNFDVNIFPYPEILFSKMNLDPNWEFILLHLRSEHTNTKKEELVAVMFCYKSLDQTYCPMIVGLDYSYIEQFKVYRKILFQTIVRAHQLKFKRINFGITANFEKKKLGAEVIRKVGYIQVKDTFNLDLIQNYSIN